MQDLSAAVDVYADWIDACDAVAKEAAGSTRLAPDSDRRKDFNARNLEPGLSAHAENDDDGFVVDDEADAEGEYADE